MPKEIHAIWWDDRLGPMIGRSYPKEVSLSSEEALRVFMGHGINQEAEIGFTNLNRGFIVSILVPPNCLAVLLEKDENPQTIERALRQLVKEIDFHSSNWDGELAQAFLRLERILAEHSGTHLLKREDVRNLINDLIAEKVNVLQPKHILKAVQRYPAAAQYLSGSDEEITTTLQNLEAAGILVAKSHGRTIQCRRCASREVRIRLACPNCRSLDLYVVYRIHCSHCGQDTQSIILDEMEEIVCQHCKNPMNVSALQIEGIEILCNQCSAATDNPVITLICASCNKQFDPIDILGGTGLEYRLHPSS